MFFRRLYANWLSPTRNVSGLARTVSRMVPASLGVRFNGHDAIMANPRALRVACETDIASDDSDETVVQLNSFVELYRHGLSDVSSWLWNSCRPGIEDRDVRP